MKKLIETVLTEMASSPKNRELFNYLKTADKHVLDPSYDHEEVGNRHTLLHFDEAKFLSSNTWIIHYSDDAKAIKEHGFILGAHDITDMAFTRRSDYRAHSAGYNFGYLAKNGHTPSNYGLSAVLFQSSGVSVRHTGDFQDPNQVIFWGPAVRPQDMILIDEIKNNGSYSYVVFLKKSKTPDFECDDFEDAVNWAIKNAR